MRVLNIWRQRNEQRRFFIRVGVLCTGLCDRGVYRSVRIQLIEIIDNHQNGMEYLRPEKRAYGDDQGYH